jgi:hypothetical protein
MPDIDEGFAPVPALTEPADPAEELTLQDAFADVATVAVGASPPVPLGRAPAYDYLERRLLPGAAGGPLMTRGVETLAGWIEKCLRTRRGENPAVDPDFGLDILAEDILAEGAAYDPSAVSEYLAAVERGLLVHPRIAGIEASMEYDDPDSDRVYVTLGVSLTGEDEDALTFTRIPVAG